MSRSKRIGFTLVELLVVITIIGMLMALLLPAVSAATENARSLKCKNRLKGLATAIASYEARFQSFPGYTNAYEMEGSGGHQERPIPWLVEIMPDMEQGVVADVWKSNSPEVPQPLIDFLICPSDPPVDSFPNTSYVINAGNAEFDVAGCGMTASKYPLHNAKGSKVPHLSLTQDKITDGTTKTVLVTENIQASMWSEASFFETKLPRRPGQARAKEGSPHNVFVWHNTTSPDASVRINGPSNLAPSSPSGPPAPPLSAGRPSSSHKGTVNVAYVDAHVGNLREDIDYRVYVQLMTPDAKKCGQEMQRTAGKTVKADFLMILSDADLK